MNWPIKAPARGVNSFPGTRYEPFVTRDADGRARFANRLPAGPVPSWHHPRRHFARRKLPTNWRHVRVVAGIMREARTAAARRWLCDNPLFVRLMWAEDARRRRRTAPAG